MYIIDICVPYVTSEEFPWIYLCIHARRIIFVRLGLYFGRPESPDAPYQASRGLQGSSSGLQRAPRLHIGPPENHRASYRASRATSGPKAPYRASRDSQGFISGLQSSIGLPSCPRAPYRASRGASYRVSRQPQGSISGYIS